MLDLATIATELERAPDGIWHARRRSAISHPDQWQEWYRDTEDTSYWHRHRARAIVAMLRRFPPGGPLFDIGGGNGFVSLALAQAGFEYVLVEPSEQGVANAQARGLAPIVCATLDDAGFRPRALAAAGLFDVLEHIEDDVGFLTRLAALLMPGGRLYLTVPAFQLLWSTHDISVGHFRRYTLASLARAVAAAGMTVEHRTYIFSILPAPILFWRALPTRLGIRRGEDRRRHQRELGARPGPLHRAVAAVLRIELAALARGWRLPVGSSCLMVARVPDGPGERR